MVLSERPVPRRVTSDGDVVDDHVAQGRMVVFECEDVVVAALQMRRAMDSWRPIASKVTTATSMSRTSRSRW